MGSVGTPRAASPDLAGEMRDFVRYRQEHLTGDEKGEGQIFLEHLFQAFGHAGLRQAGRSWRPACAGAWVGERRSPTAGSRGC